MSTVLATPTRLALERIAVEDNVRELDQEHVQALASSIALRGLIVPLVVRPHGNRFVLVAGHHRYAACKSLGIAEVEVTLREHEGPSADSAAENVLRKALSPLQEAHAVKHMLDEGYTLDGAAAVLGWSAKLVSARENPGPPRDRTGAARKRRASRERACGAREDRRGLPGAAGRGVGADRARRSPR